MTQVPYMKKDSVIVTVVGQVAGIVCYQTVLDLAVVSDKWLMARAKTPVLHFEIGGVHQDVFEPLLRWIHVLM